MKRTADSSTTSEACPKSTSHGRRASGIASGSIHTAITPSTPRRYGNGGSGQSNKGSKERKTWASRYQRCCIIAVLAEFERDIISERTNVGLEAARDRGRNGGRRKAALFAADEREG